MKTGDLMFIGAIIGLGWAIRTLYVGFCEYYRRRREFLERLKNIDGSRPIPEQMADLFPK